MDGSNVESVNRSNVNPQLEEKERQIFLLKEEKNRLEQELSTLRGRLFNGDGKALGKKFALWHILLVSLLALIVGAFFSS